MKCISRLFAAVHTGVFVACAALVAVSCGSLFQHYEEQLVRSGVAGEGAPSWVDGAITPEAGSLAFVGRGVGYDVLDEKGAFDAAVDHAREQLAEYIATHVTSEVCAIDSSRGAVYLPVEDAGPGDGEHVSQAVKARAHQMANALVGELAVVDQYWEQWDVREVPARRFGTVSKYVPIPTIENPERFHLRRYKCWVVCTIPVGRVQHFSELTTRRIEAEWEREIANRAVRSGPSGDLLAAERVAAAERDLEIAEASMARDLGMAKARMKSQLAELNDLRERVHYGRRFRLTSSSTWDTCDCAPAASRCPHWRISDVLIREPRTKTVVVEVETSAANAGSGDSFCDSLFCDHAH